MQLNLLRGRMTVDGKMAIVQQLLTDGMLPLMLSCSSSSLLPLTMVKSDKLTPCVRIARLIQSIVVEDLVPSVLLTNNNEDADDDDRIHDKEGEDASNDNKTTTEILLLTFLT